MKKFILLCALFATNALGTDVVPCPRGLPGICYAASAPTLSASVPALLGGWQNSGAPYAPIGYYKDASGIVHFEGNMYGGGTGVVFVLPPEYRPASGHFFSVPAGGIVGVLYVHTDGQVYLSPQGGGGAADTWNTHVSLSGVSFRGP